MLHNTDVPFSAELYEQLPLKPYHVDVLTKDLLHPREKMVMEEPVRCVRPLTHIVDALEAFNALAASAVDWGS